MKKTTPDVESQKDSHARVPAIAHGKNRSADELREDSELAKLVKARRRERRIKITLNKL